MNQDEFELHMAMQEASKSSFSHKMVSSIYQALKLKFPDIKGLDVFIGNDYEPCVLFEETDNIKGSDVTLFLDQFKKQTYANKHR